ncbi:terminase large subunit domain-containing protein [Herbaspirillum huttiense]|uniref:terminase large subunit domain-containing protein n=1 Tax=Herbaspirillum huttiense TaxID=863372 RepID=UPI003CD0A3BD
MSGRASYLQWLARGGIGHILIDSTIPDPAQSAFSLSVELQGQIFTQYILHFAKDTFRVELSSDPMVLPNGVRLYFFRTNARTAQGYVTLPYLSPCK